MVYKSDFRLFSFIHSEVEEEIREMERSPDFSYPNDVQSFDEYVNILKQEKIEDLEGDGWVHRRGLVIGLNVAERRFIVPGAEYVSKIFTGDVAEHVIRFSQLPTNLQRDWYDQNFSTIVPNYLMYQEREYDDERWLDASTFREPDLETLYSVLRRKGFSPMGESKFLTKNGEITEMTVFSGPLYWMQLEHLTDGKYQIRDQGSMATISRGAAKGKAVGGAVRAGELSHSAMIAHGDGNYLQERFMTAADKFKTLICSACGKHCHIMGITAATVCSTCGSRALPYQVTMPYAGVRLMSLLSVVGAAPTLKVKPKAGHTIASGFEVEEEEMEAGRFV
jgi:DNA-directed RNA polymerase beta subunit